MFLVYIANNSRRLVHSCVERMRHFFRITQLAMNRFLWPPCVADADIIIFLPCGFFCLLSFFFFFRRLISAVADWMSTVLPHMVWSQCEFRMQVWNVLHAARWKCRAHKFAIWAPSHLPHMSSHYRELWPTSDWDLLASLGHPSKFQPVPRVGFVTTPVHRRRLTQVNKASQDMFGRLLGCYIHLGVSCL